MRKSYRDFVYTDASISNETTDLVESLNVFGQLTPYPDGASRSPFSGMKDLLHDCKNFITSYFYHCFLGNIGPTKVMDEFCQNFEQKRLEMLKHISTNNHWYEDLRTPQIQDFCDRLLLLETFNIALSEYHQRHSQTLQFSVTTKLADVLQQSNDQTLEAYRDSDETVSDQYHIRFNDFGLFLYQHDQLYNAFLSFLGRKDINIPIAFDFTAKKEKAFQALCQSIEQPLEKLVGKPLTTQQQKECQHTLIHIDKCLDDFLLELDDHPTPPSAFQILPRIEQLVHVYHRLYRFAQDKNCDLDASEEHPTFNPEEYFCAVNDVKLSTAINGIVKRAHQATISKTALEPWFDRKNIAEPPAFNAWIKNKPVVFLSMEPTQKRPSSSKLMPRIKS